MYLFNCLFLLFFLLHLLQIHDVSCKVRLGVNSASWTAMLNFLRKMVGECKFGYVITSFYAGKTSRMEAIVEILEIIR